MADHIHPNTKGHNIIGQGMVAFALRSTLQQELSHIAAGAAVGTTRPRLPAPVSPLAALEADGDTFCAEGRDLGDYVDQSTARAGSWKWTNSAMGSEYDHKSCAAAKAARGDRVNCGNWGLSTHGFAKYLEFQIDTRNIPGDSTGVASSTQLDKRHLMVIYDRGMAEGAKVGTSGKPPTALVQCRSGCTCSAFEIGGDDVTYSELTATGKSEVGAGGVASRAAAAALLSSSNRASTKFITSETFYDCTRPQGLLQQHSSFLFSLFTAAESQQTN
jgi:hypothetical protein